MLSRIILTLLLPPALTFANLGAATVAGRQADDENCGCEATLENGLFWAEQPSNTIKNMCDQAPGFSSACIKENFGLVCIGSEDRTSCECAVQKAI